MAGITLSRATSQLNLYLDAEEKILAGQKVVLAGKEMTRADLDTVQKGVEIWNGRVNELSRTGGITVRGVIPR